MDRASDAAHGAPLETRGMSREISESYVNAVFRGSMPRPH